MSAPLTHLYLQDFWSVRLLLQRGLAAVYFVAFLGTWNQFSALLGEKGLLPVPRFLERVSFRRAPSVFHWKYSDRFAQTLSVLGILLSLAALLGLSEAGPLWVSLLIWLSLYVIYLSFVNVGQTFYSFGWESMLLEAGFFAAFLGPTRMVPSPVPVLILRWMLFRVELGAGLIKLRHDPCWKDLTCLYYHYETQPLPNPLSWYFHQLPKAGHRFSVLFSHFVQIVVPFGLFAPQPWASICGGLLIFHQLLLIISGNYSWLNWLTVVLGFSAFSDATLPIRKLVSQPILRPFGFDLFLYLLAAATAWMSIKPVLNLFSKEQAMNTSYNPLHLVGTYGAFGSITKKRYEIVIEGTADTSLSLESQWKEYEFRAKPGDPRRTPPQIAPYHLRLDWLMWFLPFSVIVGPNQIGVPGYEEWFIRFVEKLLEGDRETLKLIRKNPFPDRPPTHLRARFYLYQYTSRSERKTTGAWWKRTLVDEYLGPIKLR